MNFILLTGMSGAGKTMSLRYMEEREFLYVDNLPPAMVTRFMDLCEQTVPGMRQAAMVVDVRSGELFDAHALTVTLAQMREAGRSIRVLFLEASEETLINRFKETRKEHPLIRQAGSLSAAIALERQRLTPLREMADIIVDTSATTPAQLRGKLSEVLEEEESRQALRVSIQSFGFKRGAPRDADLVFDVRFLPNPFYIDGICFHTGLQDTVKEYVLKAPVTVEFLKKTQDLLTFLLPQYQKEGKRRIVIAVGCTGGSQRSVAISEALGDHLRTQGWDVSVSHRDMEEEKANWSQRT